MKKRTTLPAVLPCPFCGNQPVFSIERSEHSTRAKPHGIHWVKCGVRRFCQAHPSCHGETKADAIAEWNRRVPAKEGGAR